MATIKDFLKEFPNSKVIGTLRQKGGEMEIAGKVTLKQPRVVASGKNAGQSYFLLRVNNENYFQFQNQSAERFRHIQEDIEVGDLVELKAKQSGNFWHITDIIKIQQDSVAEPTGVEEEKPQSPPEKPVKSFVTEREKFDFNKTKQSIIIAQSTLGYALETVGLYDRTGMSAEQIDKETDRLWKKYYTKINKMLNE